MPTFGYNAAAVVVAVAAVRRLELVLVLVRRLLGPAHADDLLDANVVAHDALADDVPRKGQAEGIDVGGKRHDLRGASF